MQGNSRCCLLFTCSTFYIFLSQAAAVISLFLYRADNLEKAYAAMRTQSALQCSVVQCVAFLCTLAARLTQFGNVICVNQLSGP